tara:strand:- start:1815 stop:2714 length:900 start_codon:yes stop_codon:yes gene_type:complete
MIKYLFLILFCLFSYSVNSNENLLTIQQQLERLQREVSDLSQTVFNNNTKSSSNNNSDLVTNLSAIDIRIYDLEKDVKNLTANLEEIFFQLEDLSLKLNNFQDNIFSIENNILELRNINIQKNTSTITEENMDNNENSLGSLKISSENTVSENSDSNDQNEQDITKEVELSPEDQFQLAFDNIRNKNWADAKNSFLEFIEKNPKNQLSGSAHYWLGELYMLEKNYMDATLIFADGYQKFPESIKAPDMLFKLSQSLFEVNKINESCKTLEKLILDYPKNKLIKNAKKQIKNYSCLEASE